MDKTWLKQLKFTPTIIAILLLVLLLSPVIMIGCAILEDAILGTNYLEQAAQVTGLHKPLGKFYDALRPVFGW